MNTQRIKPMQPPAETVQCYCPEPAIWAVAVMPWPSCEYLFAVGISVDDRVQFCFKAKGFVDGVRGWFFPREKR